MLDRETFFAAQTRSAKMEFAEGRIPYSISVQAFGLLLLVTVFPALLSGVYELALLYVPGHGWCYWIERNEPRAFRLLWQRVRMWPWWCMAGNARLLGLGSRAGRRA